MPNTQKQSSPIRRSRCVQKGLITAQMQYAGHSTLYPEEIAQRDKVKDKNGVRESKTLSENETQFKAFISFFLNGLMDFCLFFQV